jgi:hypothetical protein
MISFKTLSNLRCLALLIAGPDAQAQVLTHGGVAPLIKIPSEQWIEKVVGDITVLLGSWAVVHLMIAPEVPNGRKPSWKSESGRPRQYDASHTETNDLFVEHVAGSAYRSVDMPDRAITQAVGKRVVLFVGNIGARLVQELQCLMNASPMIRVLVYGRTIVRIFAIIERRLLDVIDGRVNLAHCLHFVARLRPVSGMVLDQPARCTQVGQGV